MKKLKKGFTLVELVIVIAVIAVLAAVLIPTFSGIVQKSKVSADVQTCTAINTAITGATSMDQVVDLMADNEIEISKLSATAAGHKFVWNAADGKMLLVDSKFKVVHPADYSLESATLWQPIKNGKDIIAPTGTVLNYYLIQDSNSNITLSTLSSFDTGDSKLTGDLTINADGNTTATLAGNFLGDVTINTPNADIIQNGTMKNLNVTAVASNSLEINGYVDALAITAGKVDLQETAYVKQLTVKATEAKVVNAGVIEKLAKDANATITTEGTNANFTNNGGTVVDVAQSGVAEEAVQTTNFAMQIATLAQLENFRDSVNAGATYTGLTVKLTDDIILEDGWTPIGAFSRKDPVVGKGFGGVFDGGFHTISNLNNDGYVPTETAYGRVGTTIKNKYEYVYGFFGYVSGAEIKDVNFSNVVIDIPVGDAVYGDSVAAVVGFAYGGVNINNVVVGSEATPASSISAYDAVAGVLGRVYGNVDATIQNVTNNAVINSQEKAGGIVGYASGSFTLYVSGATNNGNVIVTAQALTLEGNKQRFQAWAGGIVGWANTANVQLNGVTVGTVSITAQPAEGLQDETWDLNANAYVNQGTKGAYVIIGENSNATVTPAPSVQ